MELVVLGQREFAGIVDEVPGFARKMLAGHGEAPARSRRALRSVARHSSTRRPPVDSPPPVDSVRARPDRIRSSSVSASPRRCSPSRRESLPAITHWHHDSPIERPVFINVPTAVKIAFYAPSRRCCFVVAWLASLRVRNYERGAPDDRRTTKKNAKRRFADFRAGVWMQTLLRDPAAGIMHSCIYFGFIGLFMATVLLEIDHQLPGSLKFLHGTVYEAYFGRRRPRGRRVPRRHRLGDRAALHPAPVPHPHQDQARRRGDPRHVPRDRRHRVPHRSRPHRARRPARLREVVVRRLPALGPRRRRGRQAGCATRTDGSGAFTSSRSSRSSRSCRPRSCATCSRRR